MIEADPGRRHAQQAARQIVLTFYWLRVFRLIGLACKVLGLLILVLSPEPIYGPFSLGAKMTKK